MEITVLSAQGLKNTSTLTPSISFFHRLRPYATVTTYPPAPCVNGDKRREYKTRVDDEGGSDPTWGDKFYFPMDTNAFLANMYSSIYIQLYTKRPVLGPVPLGWCQIPASDIGFPEDGLVRFLSYRVRDRDGIYSNGIVNLAVKFTGLVHPDRRRKRPSDLDNHDGNTSEVVIGIPVNGR